MCVKDGLNGLLEINAKNAIPLITAHLISLSNIQRMGNR
jgi:hypothetical protein